jgi:hypothetical protein
MVSSVLFQAEPPSQAPATPGYPRPRPGPASFKPGHPFQAHATPGQLSARRHRSSFKPCRTSQAPATSKDGAVLDTVEMFQALPYLPGSGNAWPPTLHPAGELFQALLYLPGSSNPPPGTSGPTPIHQTWNGDLSHPRHAGHLDSLLPAHPVPLRAASTVHPAFSAWRNCLHRPPSYVVRTPYPRHLKSPITTLVTATTIASFYTIVSRLLDLLAKPQAL